MKASSTTNNQDPAVACSTCDRPFVVKKVTLENGKVVENYWCLHCDKLPRGGD